MEYEYEKDISEACTLLAELEGAEVMSIRINVVDPEFNVVYLGTNKGVFSIQGEVGGEYLGVHRLQELPAITDQDGYIICKYSPFEIFEGHTISQARQIGSAWHGHGFELTFNDLLAQSMIIQSIYCGAKPEGFEDCLRLGVGHYENEWVKP